MSWDEILMCFLGGVNFALLVVSFIMAITHRDRFVFWNVFTAASASCGATTFFWWLRDLAG